MSWQQFNLLLRAILMIMKACSCKGSDIKAFEQECKKQEWL